MPSDEEACRQEIARSLRQLLRDLDMITHLLRMLVEAQGSQYGSPDDPLRAREISAHPEKAPRDVLTERTKALTDRENEVFRLLLTGMSNRQIGRRLGIAERTVKNNLHSIYRKLGVAGRTDAVSKYVSALGRPETRPLDPKSGA
ncbi:helix-turn-helix domain-containing protein [Streptomyces eurythermus]|uniref:helix-turn-helix domain-containing protein n=1 Tax=Streptomyces eurythermus TaxID=42237 RepID=UPI0036D3AFB8